VFHYLRTQTHPAPTTRKPTPMSGQGSTGNVIAAVCSFFIPGLGQLVQGRLLAAAVQFVLAPALWWVLLGWIVHIWSIIDAARYKGPGVGRDTDCPRCAATRRARDRLASFCPSQNSPLRPPACEPADHQCESRSRKNS